MGPILLVVLCLALGVLARQSGRVPDSAPTVLGRVVIDAALPALVLAQLPRLSPSRAWLVPALVPLLLLLLAALVLVPLARAAGWSRARLGCLLLTVGLANTSFVGFPLVEALYGARGLGVAVIVDQAEFVVLASAGIAIASWAAGREPPTALAFARRLLIFPPFVAFAVGLGFALAGLRWPAAVELVCDRLGALVVPLALLAVGYQLRFDAASLRAAWPVLAVGLGARLVLAPLAVWLIVSRAFAVHGLELRVCVAESAMSPMITAALLARDSDLEPDLAALMVGIGVPLSLATVPAWAAWLG